MGSTIEFLICFLRLNSWF